MGFIELRSNKDEVINWLQGKVDDLPTRAGYMVQEILNIYELIAGVLSPFRTGELRYSHQVELSGLTGTMVPTADHAAYVILGTSAHVIEPVDKQALYWPGASHPVKRVMHPGTRPNDYVQDAFDSADVEGPMDNFLEWLVS